MPKNQPITLPDESFELERNQQKDGGVDKAPGNKYSKQSYYQNTGRIPDQRVDIDNQFYSKPRYDPLSIVEHYGEPVPTRNANTSRNNATPPAASELSSIDNLKEKILEEVIGDVKKMNGAGGKLFNEASSVDIESKEDKEIMISTPYSSQTSFESKDMEN